MSDYFPICNLRLEHLKLEIGAQLTDDLKVHASVINRETYRKHAELSFRSDKFMFYNCLIVELYK